MISIDVRISSGMGLRAAKYSLPNTFGHRPTRDVSSLSAEGDLAVVASDLPGYTPTAAQTVDLFVRRLGRIPTTTDPDTGMTKMTEVFDEGNKLAAENKGRLSVAAVKFVYGNKGMEAIVGSAGMNTVEIVEEDNINHTTWDLGVQQDPSRGQLAIVDVFRYAVYPGDNFYIFSPVGSQNMHLVSRQTVYNKRSSDPGLRIAKMAASRATNPEDSAAVRGDVTVINLKVLGNA